MSKLFTYHFSNQETSKLQKVLNIKINPYQKQSAFFSAIKTLANTVNSLSFFKDLCQQISCANLYETPAFILKNCPIDAELPVFDIENPVDSKYQLKNTFISEAFLALYSEYTNSAPMGYKNINNGDHFHDVYPMKKLINSQSQKSLITLGFHNDLPNHIARPDWVNILCLRNHHDNQVSTTVINNTDIIKNLDSETLAILKQPIFKTPQEVISVHGGSDPDAIPLKAIYREDDLMPLCYFETRTKATTSIGEKAIAILNAVLHKVKQRVFLMPGDFISIANNYSLHAREVISLGNKQAHQKRWLQKTFNVNNINQYEKHMIDNKFRVMDE